jgi:hypothetical protein
MTNHLNQSISALGINNNYVYIKNKKKCRRSSRHQLVLHNLTIFTANPATGVSGIDT